MSLPVFRNMELGLSDRALSVGLSKSSILCGWERTGLWIGGTTNSPRPEVVTKGTMVIPSSPAFPPIPEGKKQHKRSPLKLISGNVIEGATVHNSNLTESPVHKKSKSQH